MVKKIKKYKLLFFSIMFNLANIIFLAISVNSRGFNFYEIIFLFINLVFLGYFLVYDMRFYAILNKPLYIFIFLNIFFLFFSTFRNGFFSVDLKDFGFSALIILFFIIIVFLSKEKAMGSGDIFLIGILSLFIQKENLFNFIFFSIQFGALSGIILAILKKKFKGLILPMIPFLALSFFFTLAFGDKVRLIYKI